MNRYIRTLVVVVAAAVALSIVVAEGIHFQHVKDAVPQPRIYTPPPPPPLSYLGVYEPTSPASYSGVDRFSQLIGRSPNIAVYYSSWFEPFQLSFARASEKRHALPMVQIEPKGIDVGSIAAGKYDAYLQEYAHAVRSFGQPVLLAFGHEMNADWYSWGYRHTKPAVFVAAWRHITQVFAAEKADNVRWLWTVNAVGGPRVSAISAWWPGASYVTWVGIDGHYYQLNAGFPQLFGATLNQVRKLTSHPVLVAEAGIAPYVGIAKIADLFAGARAHAIIGVVWFDVAGSNLRIENDPAAITAFKSAVSKYLTSATQGSHARGG